MRITIEDVAKVAGVSRQTVSRVLNNSPNVKPETRTRVLQTIKKLDYYPDAVARNMSRSIPNIIGFFTPFTEQRMVQIDFYSQMYAILSKECMTNDFQFQIITSHDEKSTEESLIEAYRAKKLGGVLLTCPSITIHGLIALENEGIPFVIVGRPPMDMDFYYVDHNNRQIAYDGTKHLVESGCKTIVLLNGPQFMTYSEDFKFGYTQALQDYGLDVIPELILTGDLTQASGYEQMQYLLSNGIKFDGLYVVNDMMTLGAFEAARQNGYRIPEDFQLIAGSLNAIAYMKPKVTGFLLDFDKLAKTACNMLIDIMTKKPVAKKNVIVKATPCLGETTLGTFEQSK
jgi:LacI family transcriptional regulator